MFFICGIWRYACPCVSVCACLIREWSLFLTRVCACACFVREAVSYAVSTPALVLSGRGDCLSMRWLRAATLTSTLMGTYERDICFMVRVSSFACVRMCMCSREFACLCEDMHIHVSLIKCSMMVEISCFTLSSCSFQFNKLLVLIVLELRYQSLQRFDSPNTKHLIACACGLEHHRFFTFCISMGILAPKHSATRTCSAVFR